MPRGRIIIRGCDANEARQIGDMVECEMNEALHGYLMPKSSYANSDGYDPGHGGLVSIWGEGGKIWDNYSPEFRGIPRPASGVTGEKEKKNV